MGGEIYTEGRRWGSQASHSTVSEPADPVFLKKQTPPGISPYLTTSTQIKTPASSIRDNGTQIATELRCPTFPGTARHTVRDEGPPQNDMAYLSLR